mmetsp:Transcript_104684/g.223785  ORF Transcript_104684/g.223785 Transcript_104684/m.223785 type:complete len:230 (-) Transcript_104684:141-830(-)
MVQGDILEQRPHYLGHVLRHIAGFVCRVQERPLERIQLLLPNFCIRWHVRDRTWLPLRPGFTLMAGHTSRSFWSTRSRGTPHADRISAGDARWARRASRPIIRPVITGVVLPGIHEPSRGDLGRKTPIASRWPIPAHHAAAAPVAASRNLDIDVAAGAQLRRRKGRAWAEPIVREGRGSPRVLIPLRRLIAILVEPGLSPRLLPRSCGESAGLPSSRRVGGCRRLGSGR